jgi:hypothetical protein
VRLNNLEHWLITSSQYMLAIFIRIKWNDLCKMLSPRYKIHYALSKTSLFILSIIIKHLFKDSRTRSSSSLLTTIFLMPFLKDMQTFHRSKYCKILCNFSRISVVYITIEFSSGIILIKIYFYITLV